MSTHPESLYFRVIEAEPADMAPGSGLPDGWALVMISSRKERQIIYDTFEDHAYHKGLTVVRKKGGLEVSRLETGEIVANAPLAGAPSRFFPDDLPPGNARAALERCSYIRAFIRICSVDLSIASWKILDDNQKTVAILTSEAFRHSDGKNPEAIARFYSVTPFRGYHRELARILRALPEPVDAYRVTGYRERHLMIIESAGYTIGGYSPKLMLQLDPDATIHESLRRFLQFTSTVMRQNEPGIRKELDTEFLHDYRVALRKSRSMLRQLKGVFDPHRTAWALSGLRDLGKRTNQLRDCDVYLLRKDEYPLLLPPSLRPPLARFFDTLETERRLLQRQFRMYLSSAEYRAFMAALQGFVEDDELPDQELAPNSALSTRAVAVSAVRKTWKKVISLGRRIGPDAHDSELHELRIACKKLRYILEFFSSLFPAKTAGRLVGHLKELQENLGEFVDISVQTTFLLTRLESMPTDSRDPIDLSAAIGGLVAALYRKQECARDQFGETFARFDDEQTRDLFEELLNSLQ